MSQPSSWCFCHRLPETRKRSAGRPTKCPRCMGDLIVAWRSGDTYRLVAAPDNTGAQRRGWTLAAVAGTAAVLLVGALVTVVLVQSRDTARQNNLVSSPTPSLPAEPAPAVATVPESPAVAAPSPVATVEADVAVSQTKVQPATLAEVASTKPSSTGQHDTAVDKPLVQPVTKTVYLPPWSQKQNTAEVLRAQLLYNVAEVTLEDAAETPKGVKEAKAHIQKKAKTIAEQNKGNPDAFVQQLVDKRLDLAGLPWRRGEECQLTKEPARMLQHLSLALRQELDKSAVATKTKSASTKSSAPLHPDDDYKDVSRFWNYLYPLSEKHSSKSSPMPALQQLLTVENSTFRLAYVEYLARTDGTAATVALAQRAVFDVDAEVRSTAVSALKQRSAEEYVPVLLEALKYPWPAVAQHVAEALATLQLVETVPQLVNLLSEPDPGMPFYQTVKGKKVSVVRELVRVNHLRNCLLCHAPSISNTDLVRAPIPTPGEELPRSSAVYYAETEGSAVVRADVTYLKQDFSVMQPVQNHGAWPLYQRYDYLVRVRPLNAEEQVAFARQQDARKTPPLSEHRQTILYALRALTGRDAGTSVREWQEVVLTMGSK
jgi:hypothetical protein